MDITTTFYFFIQFLFLSSKNLSERTFSEFKKKYKAIEEAGGRNMTQVKILEKAVPDDHEKFYNIVAACSLERILKHAEELDAKICVWFGQKKAPKCNIQT